MLGYVILKIDHYDDLALIGFLFMSVDQTFQGILNKKYLQNVLKKLKMVLLYLLLLLEYFIYYNIGISYCLI